MGYFNGHKVGSVIRPPLGLSTKTITLNQPGWTLARDNSCDGFVGVYAEPIDVPTETLDYIAGNDNVTTLFVPDGVARIRGNFQCFPNMTRVIIANQSTVLDIASNAWDGTNVSSIVVPNVFLQYYQEKFPTWASIITTWIAQNEFTIPYVGETTLTSEYVGQVVSVLGENRKIVTKVVVPGDFTDYSAGALNEIFEHFPNMETIESPWINGNYVDGFTLTVPNHGLTELSLDLVDSIISELPSIVKAGVYKVVVPSFATIASNCLETLSTDLTNFKDLEYQGPYLTDITEKAMPTVKNKNTTKVRTFTMKANNISIGNGYSRTSLCCDKFQLIMLGSGNINLYSAFMFQSFVANTVEVIDTDNGTVNLKATFTPYAQASNYSYIFTNSENAFRSTVAEAGAGSIGSTVFTRMVGLRMNKLTESITMQLYGPTRPDWVPAEDWISIMNVATDYSEGEQHVLGIGDTAIAKIQNAVGGPDAIAAFNAKNWTLQ